MKRFLPITAWGAALSLLTATFGAQPDRPPRLAWHFVGTAALAGNTNAALLRRALAAPATGKVLDQVRQRLADAPKRLAADHISDPSVDLEPILRRQITDFLSRESYGDHRLDAEGVPAWAVGLRVDAPAVRAWEQAWEDLARAFGAGQPEPVETPEAEVRLARWSGGSLATAFAKTEGWIGIGVGPEPLRHLARLRDQAAARRRDADPDWLQCEGDLAALLDHPAWPTFRLAVVGEGERVRTQGQLDFPTDLNLALTDWTFPTNTIREPLVGFLAVRGFAARLAQLPLWQQLDAGPAPNQYFNWSLGLMSMLSYFAVPHPDPAAALPNLAPRLQKLVETRLPYLAPGHIEYRAATNQIVLKDVMMTVPFVQARPEAEPGFLVGGVSLPLIVSGEPAPKALLDQLADTPDLVAYQWELTQPRLDHWWSVILFYSMMRTYPAPPPEGAFNRWLRDAELSQCLRNTVTEVRLTSPRTLAVNRRSSVGLTAFELVQLARWIDGEDFPRWTVRTPMLRRFRETP